MRSWIIFAIYSFLTFTCLTTSFFIALKLISRKKKEDAQLYAIYSRLPFSMRGDHSHSVPSHSHFAADHTPKFKEAYHGR